MFYLDWQVMLGNRLGFEGPILNMTTMNCMSYIGSMYLAFCHFYLALSKVMTGNARERGGIRSGSHLNESEHGH